MSLRKEDKQRFLVVVSLPVAYLTENIENICEIVLSCERVKWSSLLWPHDSFLP
jgi:hypothetical protein